MKRIGRRSFLRSVAAVAASSALPPLAFGAARERPNILLFFPDQHRFDWLGVNAEIPVRTPNLDQLCKRGVRLTRALTASPLCAPARACLASGKEYDRCRVAGNGHDYPLDQATFYALLRESGYHVAGCGKFDLHKASPTWGLDGKHLLAAWGFSDGIDNAGKWDAINSGAKQPKDPYMAYLQKQGLLQAHVADFQKRRGSRAATFPTRLPDDAYCDNWIANNGLELLRRAPDGKPWFLQVNFNGPHEPWDVTERMAKLYEGVDFPPPNRNTQLTAEQNGAVRRNYAAMIENIDRLLGGYVEELRKRGQLDNTVIVYSSDHGEMLGDHDRWGKSLPYQPSVGVPLIAAGPGVRRAAVSDALVSAMDLAATCLEYARLPRPGDMESRSLKALLEGKSDRHRDYVLSGLGQWRVVFDGRYKLIRGFRESGGGKKDGPEQAAQQKEGPEKSAILFDLENDPLENENIAGKAPAEVARLSQILDKETRR